MPWPKTGATHYHAQLGLPDKGCNQRAGCLLELGSRALRHAKRSGPRLLSTVPWVMTLGCVVNLSDKRETLDRKVAKL